MSNTNVNKIHSFLSYYFFDEIIVQVGDYNNTKKTTFDFNLYQAFKQPWKTH